MTLADIARKNMKRNVKSYSLYIGSSIFSIIVYFTFVTLRYNDEILAASEQSRQLSSLITASAFILMVFVAIFILYSNSFFIKKRKKEMALYALVGIRKKTIGWMLFLENMTIGILSLVIGVGLGFVLSQFFLSLLMALMGLDFTMSFSFSFEAVLHTVLVFFVLFLVTSFQGYRVIYRFALIDLFHAEKKGEALPRARLLSSIMGILLLTTGYWMALQDLATSIVWRQFGIATPLVIIGLTVLGSYLLFRSVLVYLLHVIKRQIRWTWSGLNLLTVSQLLYRIKGNALTLTIIATLSATILTAGGAVFSTYYNVEKDVERYSPFTFMWEGPTQEMDREQVEYETSFDSKSARVMLGDREMEYAVISESTFLTLAHQLEWGVIEELADDQMIIVDAFYDERWSANVETVQLQENDYDVTSMYADALFNIRTMGGTALVLSDAQYDALEAEEKSYQAIQVDDYQNKVELSQELASSSEINQFSSAVQDYRDSMESSGFMMFVGSFLGLVFLAAMGSIIYFKLMTEVEEDKKAFTILHKVGVSKRDMKRSIRHQVGMVFVAPLLLGLLHGSIALTAFSQLLDLQLFVPVLLWMLAYTLIYIGYYVVTVQSVKKTIFTNVKGGT
ncbi:MULTISPECIES: FtsX-like permease family protein [Bacillaceae]|uniref:ABC transporter permease n=1 Tax=Alkalicoccobacillus plakortidis TaxID=444060 RepID=A0A9D5DXQ5_9BACI|nr:MULTISPECIES: ABC transporter permease [Bacillaceae]KQL58963.1 ABC transporter permease [Alkalicoccobacillus plakortidis]